MVTTKQIRRNVNESIFSTWSPEMAYLLGQFKAGANFVIYGHSRKGKKSLLGRVHSITINTTNLQQLIKLQILLGSNHRIVFDNSNKELHGGTAEMRFIFGIANWKIVNDLRQRGFVQTGNLSPKNNAPFPEDMPDELIPHFMRGYFDERCSPSFKSKLLTISGQPTFLKRLSEIISDKLGIPLRTVHGKKSKNGKSFFIIYSGFSQISKIFKYLYLFVPSSLYCIERYSRWCKVLGYNEDYENIDVRLDVESLYILHEFCCENRIEPDELVNKYLGSFMIYCRKRNLIPFEKNDFVEEGKRILLDVRRAESQTDFSKAFEKLYEAYKNS